MRFETTTDNCEDISLTKEKGFGDKFGESTGPGKQQAQAISCPKIELTQLSPTLTFPKKK